MNDYHNHHTSRQIGVRQILVGLTIAIALARPEQADAQEPCVIDFNAEASLRSIRFERVKAGSDTFVPKYSSQCDVTVISGVEPPDPRIGGSRPNHFHLSYENNFSYQLCSVGSDFNKNYFSERWWMASVNLLLMRLPNPLAMCRKLHNRPHGSLMAFVYVLLMRPRNPGLFNLTPPMRWSN